jgi:hypothetical protein
VPVLRIDHVPIKGALLGVWQAAFGRVLDFKEMNRFSLHVLLERTYGMKTIKFVVKLSRGGRAAEYIQRKPKLRSQDQSGNTGRDGGYNSRTGQFFHEQVPEVGLGSL